MWNIRVVSVLCAVLTLAAQANGANYLLNGGVYQYNSDDGNTAYTFGLDLQQWLANDSSISLELVSPHGMRFPEATDKFNSVHVFEDGVLPEELDSRFSGTWMIEETFTGAQVNQYQFTVPTLLNSLNFRTVPHIVSPTDGSEVKKTFDLKWSNGTPNAFGISIKYANGSHFPSPNIELKGTGFATLSYEGVTGIAGVTISELRVSTSRAIQELETVIPVSPGADSTFVGPGFGTLAGSFSYKTFSPPISLTVIPEPASILLLTVALLCATGGHGVVTGR